MKKIKDQAGEFFRVLKKANAFILTANVKKILWVGVPLSVLSSQFFMVENWYTSFALNTFIYQKKYFSLDPTTILLIAALGIGIVDIVGNLLAYTSSNAESFFRDRVSKNVSEKFIFKVSNMDLEHREDSEMQDRIHYASSNINSVLDLFFTQSRIIARLVTIVLAIAALSYFKWWYGLVIIAIVFPKIVLNYRLKKRQYSKEKKMSQAHRWRNEMAFQIYDETRFKQSKMFQSSKYFLEKVFSVDSHLRKMNFSFGLWYAKLLFGINTWASILSVFLMFSIFKGIQSGEILAGSFLFIVTSIWAVQRTIQSIADDLISVHLTVSRAKDFFEILDCKNAIKEPEFPAKIDNEKIPSIKFDNVSFKYPGTENFVLKNLSFEIPAGQKVGIVGYNGSGKSTLVSLLCRFYDPTEGRILIDGVDIKSYQTSEYQSLLGVLFQECSIPRMPVKQIISIGNLKKIPTPESLVEAAKNAGIHDTILSWKNGYDQQIGAFFKKGIGISLGQRQKIALAQIFFREPKVVILDEPTSALDPIAEVEITSASNRVSENATKITIAHRFKSIADVERIIVIDKGEIVEDGTHGHLMLLGGIYSSFYRAQIPQKELREEYCYGH